MKFALIGTFYKRYQNTIPLLRKILEDSTQIPDEIWLMCESGKDAEYAREYTNINAEQVIIKVHPTPMTEDGKYAVIPYSNKINWALDHTNADVIVYLDNGSMPHAEKYAVMYNTLVANPSFGAVYCSQKRTGYVEEISSAKEIIKDAYCVLNYTQVMHRKTNDRWVLDMAHAIPDLADAIFWRSLHASIGPFHPVSTGEILDLHHILGPNAEGVDSL
jgi:hypothetical protein